MPGRPRARMGPEVGESPAVAAGLAPPGPREIVIRRRFAEGCAPARARPPSGAGTGAGGVFPHWRRGLVDTPHSASTGASSRMWQIGPARYAAGLEAPMQHERPCLRGICTKPIASGGFISGEHGELSHIRCYSERLHLAALEAVERAERAQARAAWLLDLGRRRRAETRDARADWTACPLCGEPATLTDGRLRWIAIEGCRCRGFFVEAPLDGRLPHLGAGRRADLAATVSAPASRAARRGSRRRIGPPPGSWSCAASGRTGRLSGALGALWGAGRRRRTKQRRPHRPREPATPLHGIES
jgi:hypothetical protein